MKNTVTCSHCNKHFSSGFMGKTQASGCAAEVITEKGVKYISGSYGSIFDMSTLTLKNCDYIQDGVICDACIQEIKDAGFVQSTRPQEFF